MADENEEQGLSRRQLQLGMGGIVASGIGVLGYFMHTDAQRSQEFEEEVQDGVDEILGELENEEYEAFDTGPQGMNIDWRYGGAPDNSVTFDIGVKDVHSSRTEELKEQLLEEPYMGEGAELYELITQNVSDTSYLDAINMQFSTGYTQESPEYSTQVDDVEDVEDLQEFYKDTLESKLET